MTTWPKWLLGILATLATAGIIGASATLASHGEDLAEQRARIDSVNESQQRIENRLERLDGKLDRVIERLIDND